MNSANQKLQTELWYTLRRYYVDVFFSKQVTQNFTKGMNIIDIGGKKKNKRGVFDIEQLDLNVKYANLDESTEPDYLCDVAKIPVEENTFDGAIMGELLEHVPNPVEILSEAHRILKPGGILLITTPFMYHVHADPFDYARYTDQWYKLNLEKIGFKVELIEKQGGFFSVMANMLKLWAYESNKINQSRKIKRMLFHKFVFWFTKKALVWDQNKEYSQNKMFGGNATGFGVVCKKI